jgi:hypothetical protein
VLAIVAVGVVGNPVEEVVLLHCPFGHLLQGGNDRGERLDLLRDHVLERYILIFLDYPFIGSLIVQERGTKIGIAEFIKKSIEGVLRPAGCIGFTVQGLVQAVGNVKLVGENVGEHILDGPLAGNAFDRHPAREADPVQEQFEFVALVHQPREEDLFACFGHELSSLPPPVTDD